MVSSAREAAMRIGLTDRIDRAAIAAGSALLPVYRWDLTESLKPGRAEWVRDKVAAGQSPAAHATPQSRGISSTVRLSPQGLLFFRYIDGTYLRV
jgi:hypothetical protein